MLNNQPQMVMAIGMANCEELENNDDTKNESKHSNKNPKEYEMV